MGIDVLTKLLTQILNICRNIKFLHMPIWVYVYGDDGKSPETFHLTELPTGSWGPCGGRSMSPYFVIPTTDKDNVAELLSKYSLTHYISNIICDYITFCAKPNTATSELKIELMKSNTGDTNINADIIELVCKLKEVTV